ncbi:TRAP transporter large permease subunit [Aromatoleum toluvorans]|uniref:TRAP transporter large permease subunit n=1 Tax=Aromatoleum toluvorans TaxID=92002 RepID=A0ABX1Q0R0_9RHOO|nr:TRAP transporter large permease subunit [Aromatoleum toluvorans]NMG45271.1 TRAP transporter large permease subunit [Aromatoleum toluvorans]
MNTIAHSLGAAPAAPESGQGSAKSRRLQLAHVADRVFASAVEALAAALIVAEICILFAGVVSRYFLHSPLVWTDEAASILFLWLASLGAVVAFRRGEHMRMTALVAKAAPHQQAFLDTIAVAAALAFLMFILGPAYEYAAEEAYITTPALELSNAWRAAALPVGLALMCVMGIIRLMRVGNWRLVGSAVATVATICAAFCLVGPVLRELGNINLLIFFVGVTAATVLIGVPIAVAFGLATFGFLSLTTSMPVMVLVGRMDEGMSHLILLSVPLFVFLGLLIEMTGMARAMVAFLASLLGHVRGGLSYVLLGAMYLVSGISGSKVADMAAVAPVLFPEMKERGAKPGDLIALLSATGAQTETIPPSLVLITIGSVTGVSIAALFTGGLLPGVVLGTALCFVVWLRYRNEDLSKVRKASRSEIWRAFRFALPALALPFVIRAAVVEGVATATEVSTLGIAYALLVGLLLHRDAKWSRLFPMLVETAALSGAILLIIGTATGMAWSLTQSGFSTSLAQAMAALPGGAPMFLAVSIVAFIILGSVLEGIPAIVLFGPLLFPIARAMGVHEVHYAMVVVLSMGVGLFAPPFGVGYYAACAIGKVKPEEGVRPIIGYVLALLTGLAIVAAVPWISTGLL